VAAKVAPFFAAKGLAGQQAVAAEMLWWGGSDAPSIAKAWFENNLGITFSEETRPIKTYVVGKK
jgi:hypothetical protein